MNKCNYRFRVELENVEESIIQCNSIALPKSKSKISTACFLLELSMASHHEISVQNSTRNTTDESSPYTYRAQYLTNIIGFCASNSKYHSRNSPRKPPPQGITVFAPQFYLYDETRYRIDIERLPQWTKFNSQSTERIFIRWLSEFNCQIRFW